MAARALAAKATADSCKKMMSALAYVLARMDSVRSSLCRLSASHISCRRPCHLPRRGRCAPAPQPGRERPRALGAAEPSLVRDPSSRVPSVG
eukprot:scaffold1053_cov107-Isochrysis_galbana.AAC.22